MALIVYTILTLCFGCHSRIDEKGTTALASIPDQHEIDSMSCETLKEWDIPGMAIAVVHKGKNVAIAGYGVKQRGGTDLVNEETLFQIASLSKAFTAASIGTLVEEGKLHWERPITHYLPNFHLKDPVATEEMTLRDLLSHRTGLPGISRGCWRLWSDTDRSSDELVRRLANVDPAYPFRSHFSYNNVAYVIASQIAESTSGIPWPLFCEQRIFSPLGMTRTNMSHDRLIHDTNAAFPHLRRSFCEQPIAWSNWDALAAAGGINSCAKDMALWLKYCLTLPTPLKESLRPQTLMEPEGFLNPIRMPTWPIYVHDQKIVGYGFGWVIYSVGGKTVFFHFGLSDGMQSDCAIVPEEGLGIAILTNQEGHLGASSLLNLLVDRFLGQPPTPWHQKAHAVVAEIVRSVEATRKQLKEGRRQRPPTFPAARYVGHYEHPAYGSIWVRLDNGQLTIELWNEEKGILKPWDEDRFEITGLPSGDPLPMLVDFEISQEARQIEGLHFPELGFFPMKKIGVE